MKFRLLAVCTIFLAGCDGFIDGMLEDNAEVFNASYKESFVKSCAEPENTAEKTALCSCVADDLIANHSPKELIDQSTIEKYIQEIAIPLCIQGQEPETQQAD